jgi:signal transduction histidine kinase
LQNAHIMPEHNPPLSDWDSPAARVLHGRAGDFGQSQRLEAMAELSSEVAHDVNNALQVIKSAVEILRRRLPSGEADVARMVDMLARNADGAASLMQQLLGFAGRLPLEPKPIDVNELVAGMAGQLREAVGDGVCVDTALGSEVWGICADPGGLQTAMLNLCANGRDAVVHKGVLTIETRNVQSDKSTAATGNGPALGEYVSITVRDNGSGMTPQVVAKVFDPYFTTKETGKGTGFGLSQVYGFMKQSNGYIDIDSAPGKGTSVTLCFPRMEAAGSAP